jgi:hypothetical protein
MKNITRLLFTIFLLSFSYHASAQIVINEVVSSNTSVNIDEDGSYQDWVELYNNGPSAVNLFGYGLTDDSTALFKWVFPNVTVPAGGYLLVYCSDKNRTTPGQPLHTNWKIGASGEVISLTNPGSVVVDLAPATAIPANQSLGRLPNGTGGFSIIVTPTPGAFNSAGSTGGQLDPPVFSQNSGFFTTGFTLAMTTAEPGATILYTLDGSEPSATNLGGTTYNYKNSYPKLPEQAFGPMLFRSFQTNTYSAALSIIDRTPEPNKIANTSSTYDFAPDYFPGVNIFKATIIRAKVIKAGFTDSPVVTRNYFISPTGSNRYTLPVISLSIDENKLFDYEDGIYVAGKLFDDWRVAHPTTTASGALGNYDQKGSAYERVANLHYFVNGQPVLNQDVGIRIQGNNSRLYPSKSLNIYSRGELGVDGMAYKFFSDEPYTNFQRIVFKNSASDFYQSLFKDALCSELAKPLHTQTEASQPAVAFINGEYWGLLTVREKYDDEFFLRVYGIPKNEIELLENDGYYVEEGTNTNFLALFDYFEENSIVPQANYDYIQTQMDLESYIDYYCSEIYFANGDWPGNNIIFWRRNVPYNPNAAYGNDGRWRWAIHDMSSTFSNYNENTLAVATEPDGPEFPNPEWSTMVFRKLLENPDFKNKFITRFADVLNSTYHPTRVTAKVQQLRDEIAPEMAEQIVRWKAPFEMAEWNYFVGKRFTFATERPAYQRDHIRAQFGITNNINVTVSVSNPTHGFIKVNTIEISDVTVGIPANPYPWTGVYFSGIPVKLKAIAKPGYMFSHWTGASTATTDEITITSNLAFSVTAVFAPVSFAAEVQVPINFWYMNGAIQNDTPLATLGSFYEVATDGVINFQSAFAGYPYNSVHPNWRKASMERRNKPTPINYRPDANGNTAYIAGDMKGLQITQPFQDNGIENTLIFNLSTKDYKNIKFSFAAMDEGAATGIVIDYSVNSGTPVWITAGLAATSFALVNNSFQLYEADFTAISTVNDNPNFKIRLRFTGPNMSASAGNRVTFNNIALDGVKMPLLYLSPNSFTVGVPIAPLSPTIAASATSFSVLPALPAGLILNTATGVISGTPTTISATNTYTITAANAGGTASYGVVITVNDVAPTTLSYATPNVYTIGSAISSLNPSVTGNIISYSVSPALPNGLSLNTSTGVISGTPNTVTGVAIYTVTATNSGGNTSFGVSIRVDDIAPGALSYTTPNIYTVGSAISSLNPSVTGNVISYSVSPALPNGLSLNIVTGVISGTPTAVTTTATYTVTATNSGGNTSFGVSIRVNDIAPGALSYTTPNIYTVGSAISSLNPSVTGNVISYSVSPALPNGLSLNIVTGVISGTPTAVTTTATYTVTATNSGGNTSFGVSIRVDDIAPGALSYTTPNIYTVGSAIASLNPIITGNVISYSVSPALPNGLSLNTSTGVISGTPNTVTGVAIYTVTATNSGGNTSFGVSIRVDDIAPGALSYATPNIYTVGSAIASLNPIITGNVISYSVSPALPNGLSLNTSTGVISGTPNTVTGVAIYTVTATNSGGNTSFGVSIRVDDIAPGALSYMTPNVYTVGSAIASLNPIITGNVISYSVSPALPNGLSLNTSTGVISGTPNTVTGVAIYTVTATNSGGNTSFGVSIRVDDIAPGALSYATPNVYTVGSAIASLNPIITGNVISYSVSPALPNGLSLNTSTGVISGTPTAVTTTATYTVTATNSGGNTSFGVSIRVDDIAPGALSYATPNVFTVGSAISSLNPTVTGNVISYSVSPALPNGLSLNTSTGVISGTPNTVTGVAIYTITATNSGGNTSFGVSIRVDDIAPGALSYATPNVFTVGSAISSLNPTVTGNVISYSVSPALPNGLSLNTSTGVISGTPTAVTTTATYTVTATNSGGNISFGVSIRVDDIAPGALSYATPNVFTVGSAISSLNPTVTGNVISYSVSPALPNGLSLNTSTGVISGTPTAVTGVATYTVTATNSGGDTSFGVSITVNDIAPSLLNYPTPNIYTIDETIAPLTPLVVGNVISYSVSPTLPEGLSMNTFTGAISGTPTVETAAQTYNVTAMNSGGNVSFGVIITVHPPAPFSLTYATPNTFTVGAAIINLTPTISGNVDSFSIIPALPDGLSFDTATGIISGTPTGAIVLTTYLITASNSGGNVSFALSITVNDLAPSSLSYTTPNVYTVGSVIVDLMPTITGNAIVYSVSPTLPDGLSIDATTGIISGTPTTITATTIYTVTATNSGGNTSFDISITVNDVAPNSLAYTTPNVYTVGSAIVDLNPTVTGNNISYSVSPALPDGLFIDVATGIISGTPTTITATTIYTVTATNSGGNTTFDISITVNDVAPGALSYATPNIYTVGSAISSLNPTITGNNISYSVSPALPDGLFIDVATGIISGTPTTITATTIYTVTATNSGGNTTFDISITVNDVAPNSLSYTTPNIYTVGSAISSLNPTITGNNISYSVSPALPDGLFIDVATGIISGTPTTITATTIYTVTATNSGGNTTFDISITVNDVAPNSLSYTTPNIYTVGSAISSLNPTITGNIISYSVSPALPDGLFIDVATGIISGTPTTITATTIYTVTATNSGGNTTFDISITVNDVIPSGLSYPTPNEFTTGEMIIAITPTVTGNVSGFSVSPDLPIGLSIDPITGIISGTPSIATLTATYVVTAANSGGSVSFDVVITVSDPLGIGENNGFDFSVWPNPFTGIINISGIIGHFDYDLYAIDGRLLESGKSNVSQLMFDKLPDGVYLLQLKQDNQTATKKIIKMD